MHPDHMLRLIEEGEIEGVPYKRWMHRLTGQRFISFDLEAARMQGEYRRLGPNPFEVVPNAHRQSPNHRQQAWLKKRRGWIK
jgi:hypothetical protein